MERVGYFSNTYFSPNQRRLFTLGCMLLIVCSTTSTISDAHGAEVLSNAGSCNYISDKLYDIIANVPHQATHDPQHRGLFGYVDAAVEHVGLDEIDIRVNMSGSWNCSDSFVVQAVDPLEPFSDTFRSVQKVDPTFVDRRSMSPDIPRDMVADQGNFMIHSNSSVGNGSDSDNGLVESHSECPDGLVESHGECPVKQSEEYPAKMSSGFMSVVKRALCRFSHQATALFVAYLGLGIQASTWGEYQTEVGMIHDRFVSAGHHASPVGPSVFGLRVGFHGERIPFGRKSGAVRPSQDGRNLQYVSAKNASTSLSLSEDFSRHVVGFWRSAYSGFRDMCSSSGLHSGYSGYQEIKIKTNGDVVYKYVPYSWYLHDMDTTDLGDCYFVDSELNRIIDERQPLCRTSGNLTAIYRLRGGTAKAKAKVAPKASPKVAPKAAPKSKTTKKTTMDPDEEEQKTNEEPDPNTPGGEDETNANGTGLNTDSLDDAKTFQGKVLVQRFKLLSGTTATKSDVNAFLADIMKLTPDVQEKDSEVLEEIVSRCEKMSITEHGSGKQIGQAPTCSSKFNTAEYESYRTNLLLWHSQNKQLTNNHMALLLLSSLDEATKQHMLTEHRGNFTFDEFLKTLDMKFQRNRLAADMSFENNFRQQVQPQNVSVAEFCQTMVNGLQKMKLIHNSNSFLEDRFAIKLLSKFKTISSDKRTELTQFVIDTYDVVDDKNERAYTEVDVCDMLLRRLAKHGAAQELSKAAQPANFGKQQKVFAATAKGGKGGNPHKGKGGPQREIKKPGGKGKFGGKGGKGKSGGKGKFGANVNLQAFKGAKKNYRNPPARPPNNWTATKDWQCGLCSAYNFLNKKDGTKSLECWFCKRQKQVKKTDVNSSQATGDNVQHGTGGTGGLDKPSVQINDVDRSTPP